MAPRINLDVLEKRKIYCPLPAIEPRIHGCPVRGLVTVPTELHGNPNEKMTPIPVAVPFKGKDCWNRGFGCR